MKINTTEWKEFRVGDLFTAKRGKSRTMRKLETGNTSLIAAARNNQGVSGLYNIPSEYERAITVSCNGAGCGSTFYHNYPFAISGDAVVLEDKIKLTQYAKIFIASMLDSVLFAKYSYEDKCSSSKIEDEIVLLPTTSEDYPDQKYMEDYIKSIEDKCKKRLNKLKQLSQEENKKINITGWKEFRVGDIFPQTKIIKHSKIPISDGDNEFISSSSYNNGVAKLCDEKTIPGNCITVSTNGKCFDCFYHRDPIVPSNDVEVLYNKNLTMQRGLFICSILNKEQGKYSHTDKPKNGKVFTTKVKLPVTESGEPDWQYMENYIKAIEDKCQKRLNTLKQLSQRENKKINITGWKEFIIEDLFQVLKSRSKIKNVDLMEDGLIPVYSSTTERNGVFSHTNIPAQYIIDKQNPFYLIFGDHTKSMFIATESFNTMDNVKVLTPKQAMSKHAVRFIITQWLASIPNLGYARHWSLAKSSIFFLPTRNGIPDWQYMEDYIKAIEDKCQKRLDRLKQLSQKENKKISITEWKGFKIKDLNFTLFHGTRIKKTDRVDGDTIFLTAGKENHGVAGKIGNTVTVWSKPITVDMFGNCFFHPYNCSGDDNIYAFINNEISDYAKVFIASSIHKVTSNKYSYAEQFRQKNIDELTIFLPVNANGDPDWQYMEEYIKNIETKCKNKLKTLKQD